MRGTAPSVPGRGSRGHGRIRPRGGLQGHFQGDRTVPRREIVEVGDVDDEILFDQLVPKGDSQRLETRASLVVGTDAIGSNQENEVRNGRCTVRRVGRSDVQQLLGDRLDERARSTMDQRRKLQRREGPPLELQLDSACRAFQDDRPLPGAVGSFVWQDCVARPSARLGQGGFQCIPLAGQHVTFRIKRLSVAVQSLGSLRESRDLLANQHLAPFPPLRLGDRRLACRLEPDSSPVSLPACLQLLRGRRFQCRHGFLRWIFRSARRYSWFGRFLNDCATGGCVTI